MLTAGRLLAASGVAELDALTGGVLPGRVWVLVGSRAKDAPP